VRSAAIATYRLQLHRDVNLQVARSVVPYLARLGISHLYASPLLQARADSRHGYDVVDPTRLDPKLGSPADLDALVRALRRFGMGLVVDVVPNHMAIGSENRFWEETLAHGEASPCARWFDVAWRSPTGRVQPLRLPVLGDVRGRVIRRGELGLVLRDEGVRVRYFDASFPVDPATLAPLVATLARRLPAGPPARTAEAVALELAALPAREPPAPGAPDRVARAQVALARLSRLLAREPRARASFARVVAAVRGPALERFLRRQPYHLVYWRRAAGDVNYRRFFAVSELVGLRIEDPHVFAATHAYVVAWAGSGAVDALRIDHVDGLADPLGYLRTLRAALDEAGAPDVAVLVEKILTGGEQLRADWPVAGTTGYEFLNALDAVFVDPRGFAALTRWYRRIVGDRLAGFHAVAWRGKRDMAATWLAPDVRRLVQLLPDADRARRRAITDAIVELLTALPVYRSYVDGRRGSPMPADRRVVLRALAVARRSGRATPAALRRVTELLLAPGALGARGPFVRRFQQLGAALMAKGVEDTALYRWTPLASRNEVGGDPSASLTDAVRRLHAHDAVRARRFPAALSATTTHDTKRSADARARLHVLSELPAVWTATVAAWRARHRRWRRRVGARLAPDAATEYLLYQSALAIWPPSGPGGGAAALDAVGERLRAYAAKAAREAAVHTSWLEPNEAWESALDAFARAVLSSAAFRDEMTALVGRVARPGLWTALARTLVHLTAPGVPDLYQGDELWRFTLVDPDNRGDVDFAHCAAVLLALEREPIGVELVRDLIARPEDGRLKLHVIRAALGLRRVAFDVFRGGYVPLERGTPSLRHVVAFARTDGRRAAITIVPRLVWSLMRGRPAPPIGRTVWRDTTLRLPPAFAPRRLVNVLTGEAIATSGGELALADALAECPVALLWSAG
jgi:(1->4)-alpha-D-glucan 1-alpha-D-glucosylmutase